MGEHATSVHGVGPSTTPAAAGYCKGASSHSYHTAAAAAPCRSARPTIRIIHIVAPEIIKTDAANFRDLVQRLTGRQQQQQPAAEDSTVSTVGVAAAVAAPLPAVEEKLLVVKEEKGQGGTVRKRPAAAALLAADYVMQEENKRRKKIKCEVVKVENASGFGGGGDLDLGELWMDLNPEGFLSIFEEDIFRGMTDSDLLQPFMGSSRMDFVSEMCSSYLA